MTKNLCLVKSRINGYETFRLICNDSTLADFYDDWAYQLAKKYSYNTMNTYCHAVASFLDYIFEISSIYDALTPQLMIRAIDSYESYLVFGTASTSDLAKAAAANLKPTSHSGSSIVSLFAGINSFIDASENFRVSLQYLEDDGLIDSQRTSEVPLFDAGTSIAPQIIRKKIRENSWLGSCIKGGAKKLKNKSLSPKVRRSSVIYSDVDGGDKDTFPFDRGSSLMAAASNDRNRLLWSLIAATGCRISEALTLLIDDIDLDKRKISIVPPVQRKNTMAKYLSDIEINRFSHKGRNTNETYLIRPYDLIFWKTLEDYMESWYKRGADHRFLFQKKNGKPYVRSYRSALADFQKASKTITSRNYGFHSLRHMYGYYLKNWIPNTDGGLGFSLTQVQSYMGHESIESTKRYARDDAMKLRATISYSSMLHDQQRFISVKDQKIKELEAEIDRIQVFINSEKSQLLE